MVRRRRIVLGFGDDYVHEDLGFGFEEDVGMDCWMCG